MAIRYLSGINVDSNTLFVNSSNDFVGVGTNLPSAKLQVSGAVKITGGDWPSGYAGLEFNYVSNTSYIGSYDRTNSVYKGLFLFADNMTFETGGSVRMYITTAGNVGIGNTSPNGALSFADDTRTRKIVLWDGAANNDYQFYGLGVESSTFIQSIYANGDRFLWVAGTGTTTRNSLMVLTGDGNLGIGTTAPGTNLEITTAGSSTTVYPLSLTNPVNEPGTVGGAGIRFSTSSGPGGAGNEANKYSSIEAFDVNNYGSNSGLSFTTSLGYTKTKSMVIDRNGNVGIGTTSPNYKLQVAGNISILNGASDTLLSGSALYLEGGSGSNYTILQQGIGRFTIWGYNGSSWGEKFTINNTSGNVGIGTTAPSSKLNIVGGFIRVEGTEVDQFFLEGTRTGTSTTVRIYDNSSVVFYDSYSSMIFRANQNGGSGGYIGLFGGNVGVNEGAPSQRLHVNGNIRVTGAYYDSNNEAGTSGQVLSSTGSGTDWVTPATTTATSLYDLLPAARVAYNWTVQMTSGTWADIFSSTTVLSNGTWMVQVYVDDYASGGQQYQETYSGVMSWGNANSTNQGGASAISEVVLHRSGHAANAGQFYLRTQERATSTLLLQGMINYSHTSNTTINFKFVKVF